MGRSLSLPGPTPTLHARRPSGRASHARWKSTTTRTSPVIPERCPATAPLIVRRPGVWTDKRRDHDDKCRRNRRHPAAAVLIRWSHLRCLHPNRFFGAVKRGRRPGPCLQNCPIRHVTCTCVHPGHGVKGSEGPASFGACLPCKMEVHDDPHLTGNPGAVPSHCALIVRRLWGGASQTYTMWCG